MAQLLPRRPSVDRGEGLRLEAIDDEAADEVFDALSSGTARSILAAVYDEPAPASELAEAADTSLQNARYHIEKLVDAELIDAADTWYSEQGREMTVYAPADESVVVVAGDPGRIASLRGVLERVVGVVALLAVASLVAGAGVRRWGSRGAGGSAAGPSGAPAAGLADGGGAGSYEQATPATTPTESSSGADVSLNSVDTPAATDAGGDATATAMPRTTGGVRETATPGGASTPVATESPPAAVATSTKTSTPVDTSPPTATVTETPTPVATETPTATPIDGAGTTAAPPDTVAPAADAVAATGPPPELVFFLGGLFVLTMVGGWLHWSGRWSTVG
jgi:DNA-binding transcriptional ArsR family regulator